MFMYDMWRTMSDIASEFNSTKYFPTTPDVHRGIAFVKSDKRALLRQLFWSFRGRRIQQNPRISFSEEPVANQGKVR